MRNKLTYIVIVLALIVLAFPGQYVYAAQSSTHTVPFMDFVSYERRDYQLGGIVNDFYAKTYTSNGSQVYYLRSEQRVWEGGRPNPEATSCYVCSTTVTNAMRHDGVGYFYGANQSIGQYYPGSNYIGYTSIDQNNKNCHANWHAFYYWTPTQC